MNQNEIINRLKEPFDAKEIEWKIQMTTQDKTRGLAVPYIDNRAIQKRLDETAGIFGWRNEFDKWHDNSQLCGISVYCEERKEWITKYDGADNSDFEPVKGGLSDSMKRAAVLWGIGRYLYELDGIWVDIEQRGKSYAIKKEKYAELNTEYNNAVKKIFGTSPAAQSSDTSAPSPNVQPPSHPSPHNTQTSDLSADGYKVLRTKLTSPSTQVIELADSNGGEVTIAYIKKDVNVKEGVWLRNVGIVEKPNTSGSGSYKILSSYNIAA